VFLQTSEKSSSLSRFFTGFRIFRTGSQFIIKFYIYFLFIIIF